MKLLPAIRYKGKTIVGDSRDSHATIMERRGIKHVPDEDHGFSPNGGRTFLTRKMALGWMKQYDPKGYEKLQDVPAEGLHSANLAEAKGVGQKEVKEDLDLSTKTAIVYDRGLYLFMAEKLAETFKKVYYYMPQSEPYPCSRTRYIGTGLKNIERVYEFWKYLDKVDLVVFPDCYDSELQHFLREKGYAVFGNGRGEKLEMDKVFFLDTLQKVGLPIAKTYIADGLTDLSDYLQKNEKSAPMWLKTSYYRGDFETHKFSSVAQITPWIDHLRQRIGKRGADEIRILVQHKIDSDIEIGYDGFAINGEYTGNCIVGYEVKDSGFVGSVQKEPAPVVKTVNDKIAPVLKKLGYMGHFSTEIRVTSKGVGYFIDPTCRLPSPPSELMVEIYENYAEIVWEVAHGRTPTPKAKKLYGAEVILTSSEAEDMSLCVKFPKSIAPWVKLKNHTKEDDHYYCIPNGNAEFIGAVVGLGDTIDEAISSVLKYVEMLEVDGLHIDPNIFEKAKEQIEKGRKHGVIF